MTALGQILRRLHNTFTKGDQHCPDWSFVEQRLPTAFRAPTRLDARYRLTFEGLESRHLLATSPIITEFMADNDDNIGLGEVETVFGKPDPFGDGTTPDWIEIHNAGDQALNLHGYYLTDDADDLTQWMFPNVVLEPDGYQLVFASGMDGQDVQGRLHTNFGLRSRGEYLALVAPDQKTVVSEFSTGRDYPPQVSNVSYGFVPTIELISPQSDSTYWVPQHGDLGMTWTLPDFSPLANGFSSGQSSLGYETRPAHRTNYVGLFETELPKDTQSVFVRMEVDWQDAVEVTKLFLKLQYDNGFIAYLNGVEVARDNAPDDANWTSSASSISRRDTASINFEGFDLSDHLATLQNGTNVLGIHLLNHPWDSSDLLLGVKLLTDKPLATSDVGYLFTPTPGAANVYTEGLTGPIINNVTQNPGPLADDQDLLVTARVRPNNSAINSVRLQYRIMFEHEVAVAMVDDGTAGDITAGDGIYSATIPATVSEPGQMVRWKVTATDVENSSTRRPLFAYPDNSDEYYGTMIFASDVQRNLPVLNWFIDDINFRGASGSVGGRGSIFYLDQFYDNVSADDHGQTTRSFQKKSYDLDFNQENRFEWRNGERRVRDVNLITNWGDKGKFRHALAYDMYRDAGSPAFFAFPVRVQRNGEFFSIADMIEDADDRTLERLGLNPDGALYKVYDAFTSRSTGAWKKKTILWEDKSDLAELQEATRLEGQEWIHFALDNIDIPAFVNFLPLFDLQNNKGCCQKNYYMYRDTGATNEWQMIIWDPDLAFGHDYKSGSGYFDDVMDWDNPLFSERGTNNALLKKLYDVIQTPGFNEMYLRRLRSLMDKFLQPSDTPYADRYLERRIDEYVDLMDPNDDPFDPTPTPPNWPDARNGVVLGTDDADLDYNTWGSWDHANGSRLHAARGETMRENVQRTKGEYLNQRRDFLYGLPELPAAQVDNPVLEFGVIETAPSGGDPAKEYLELVNPHNVAVDITGWQLTGSVDYTFPPGTVIPSGWTMYVAADKVAFRMRARGPTGGQGLFVVGGWVGQLSVDASLNLVGADGAMVQNVTVPAARNPGNANRDGRINTLHIDELFEAVHAVNHSPRLDVTGDGRVDMSDVDELIKNIIGTEYGDVDLDGDVDVTDFETLAANFGANQRSWSHGDFDGDGEVDFFDFNILSTNFDL